MTNAEAFYVFHAVLDEVSEEARHRYRLWVTGPLLSEPPFNLLRLEWCMSDPEWSEAILLARLGGK